MIVLVLLLQEPRVEANTSSFGTAPACIPSSICLQSAFRFLGEYDYETRSAATLGTLLADYKVPSA